MDSKGLLNSLEPSRRVRTQVLTQRGDVPCPQQGPIDESVDTGCGGIFFRGRRSHHGIRCHIDPRALDLAKVKLVHPTGMNERNLDVEPAGVIPKRLDRLRGLERTLALAAQHRRSGIPVAELATESPVA